MFHVHILFQENLLQKGVQYLKRFQKCCKPFVKNCPCTSFIQDLLTPHTLCHPNIRAKNVTTDSQEKVMKNINLIME